MLRFAVRLKSSVVERFEWTAADLFRKKDAVYNERERFWVYHASLKYSETETERETRYMNVNNYINTHVNVATQCLN